jgi:hypothetical protein
MRNYFQFMDRRNGLCSIVNTHLSPPSFGRGPSLMACLICLTLLCHIRMQSRHLLRSSILPFSKHDVTRNPVAPCVAADDDKKLALLYLCNEIVQTSKRKGYVSEHAHVSKPRHVTRVGMHRSWFVDAFMAVLPGCLPPCLARVSKSARPK